MDIQNIRNDFPMIRNNQGVIYFDSGATTFKPDCVINAVNDFYSSFTANVARGDYKFADMSTVAFEKARKTVQKFINAKSEREVVFTSGATESLNTVAMGYGLKYLTKDDVILMTHAEHASNILPWFKVAEVTGAKIEYIRLDEAGVLDFEDFKNKMNEKVKVVTITYVSNVLGYKNPIKEITKLAHEFGAIVNVDGAQSVPHIKTDVLDLDIDFLSFSAHKMLGPSGVGVLYGKTELLEKCDPLMLGGGANNRFTACGELVLKKAPYKFEAGTPNIEGVIGLAAAIEYLNSIGMEQIEKHDLELGTYLVSELAKLENVTLLNPKASGATVSFNVKGIFAQDVAVYLNSKGLCLRSGNHCAKALIEVTKTMDSLRASLYIYNTKEEIDVLIEALKECTLEKCIGAAI